jgi:hypothetical protein
VAVAVLAAGSALRAQGVDLTGAWIFNVTTDAGGGTPTVTFKQAGEKLTGHYSSMVFGEVDFTGEVKGKEFMFKFMSEMGDVIYKGTIESANSLKGTGDLGGVGAATFTAERKK